jgi:sugar O-acyltransferase (sialic acid O-acetyltransferase NeuD family)
MSRSLVIVGAGGFGREVLDVVEAILDQQRGDSGDEWRFLGFLDDQSNDTFGRGEVLGPVEMLGGLDADYLIGIGDPTVRQAVAEATDRMPATVVHPGATIGPDVVLGPGTVVTAGVRVTNHVRVGKHVHLNLNATVGHDAVLGDYVTVNPGANVSGNVTLGEGVTLGTGSQVIQGRTVGAWTTVGAGGVVVRDLEGGLVAVGIPAVPLSRK